MMVLITNSDHDRSRGTFETLKDMIFWLKKRRGKWEISFDDLPEDIDFELRAIE